MIRCFYHKCLCCCKRKSFFEFAAFALFCCCCQMMYMHRNINHRPLCSDRIGCCFNSKAKGHYLLSYDSYIVGARTSVYLSQCKLFCCRLWQEHQQLHVSLLPSRLLCLGTCTVLIDYLSPCHIRSILAVLTCGLISYINSIPFVLTCHLSPCDLKSTLANLTSDLRLVVVVLLW